MYEFVTAARDTLTERDEDHPITFLHDEREVTFYEPTPGQMMLIASAMNSSDLTQAGSLLSFFLNLCDEASARYFYSRLMDRNDTFEIDSEGGVSEIMEWLFEQWSARPTKQPSDYRRKQQPTGQRSTATTRARASTSSASRRAASSASSSSG